MAGLFVYPAAVATVILIRGFRRKGVALRRDAGVLS